MHIKLNDLHAEYLSIKDEIDEAIQRVLNKSSFIMGEEVERFEQNFAKYIGAKYCIGVSSCTAALYLAMKVHGIREGAMVGIPVRNVTASAEAAKMLDAIICLYDDDPDESMAVMVAVHLYGKPIRKIKHRGDCLIEDCAQATGASIKGRKCGTFGDIACFSFSPSKPLGCYGDGGAIVIPNENPEEELPGDYADHIRALRDHGRVKGKKYEHKYSGFNFRLDGIQAAVLNVKLPYLDRWIAMRAQAAARYNERLKDVEQVSCPRIKKGIIRSWYVYAISVERRNELSAYLGLKGIQAGIHYPIPVHQQPAFSDLYNGLSPDDRYHFPKAEKWAATTLSLPMYAFISEEQIEYVCNMIKGFYS